MRFIISTIECLVGYLVGFDGDLMFSHMIIVKPFETTWSPTCLLIFLQIGTRPVNLSTTY